MIAFLTLVVNFIIGCVLLLAIVGWFKYCINKWWEMKSWSIEKLHAYAGVKDGSHPKFLRNRAYHLAKRKKFEEVK